ncbi:MAG: radical SAM protein [Acidobacteriota bacterium]|jgi:7-carboxy-7-deazaguanine synthase
MGEKTLLVNEIYDSIQGEGPEQGFPIVLVRLTGCNLRCTYCDSRYTFYQGDRMTLGAVLERVEAFGHPRVLVTGGEPMAQAGTADLCRSLVERGFKVSIETNGAYALDNLPVQVMKLVDVKTPGSGEAGCFQAHILDTLDGKDVLKFVLTSEEDYVWTAGFVERHRRREGPQMYLSPAWGALDPASIAEWMVRDHLDARLQVQIHKILWGDKRGR